MNETLIYKATQIFANSIAAQIEMQSMIVANKERENDGKAYAYTEKDFIDLISRQGIGYNQIIEALYHN